MEQSAIAKPRRILLATDLSARCDRALDRAVQLAGEARAELIAACIVGPDGVPRRSGRRLQDPVERMRQRLKRDLTGAADGIRPIVEEGDAAEKLLEIAAREGCDLIVTGAAGPESIGRMMLGSTVNRLARGSAVPILVVHDRPRQPYRNILVATDFSEASVQALRTASALFPGSRLTLFHGYDIPLAGFAADQTFARELRAMEADATGRLLNDERIDPDLRKRVSVVVRRGAPEILLGDFIEERNIDLTVIGSHGRGAFFDALIGSTAKRLVEALEGDLLILRHAGSGE